MRYIIRDYGGKLIRMRVINLVGENEIYMYYVLFILGVCRNKF